MKIEPIEYLVTFEDGKEFSILKTYYGDTWKIVSAQYHNPRLEHDRIYLGFNEALEVLKKWKEKQDAR